MLVMHETVRENHVMRGCREAADWVRPEFEEEEVTRRDQLTGVGACPQRCVAVIAKGGWLSRTTL